MRKLKLVMSDKNFTNAVVYDEDGDAIGHISEVSIRVKRKVLLVKLGGDKHQGMTSEDLSQYRDVIKSALEDPSTDRDPFVIFNGIEMQVGTIELDDYEVENAKLLVNKDGEWVSEEELIVKDIIE